MNTVRNLNFLKHLGFNSNLYNRGVDFYYKGNYELALEAFDKAIEIKPDDAKTWSNKGVALGKLGRYDDALKAFDKAIEIKPEDAEAWYNKACIYSLRGDKVDALKTCPKQ